MPKERFSIKTFNGAAPATGDAESPIRFENARVDVANNVAVPENVDAKLENSDVILIEKKMYVDGVERYLRIYQDGSVYVDGVSGVLGHVTVSENLSVEIVGRQAVITDASGNAKFIRIGFPGVEHIGFGLEDIIFEDDRISADYLNFGEIRDMIALNPTNYILLYKGSTTLMMMYRDTGDWIFTKTDELSDGEILAIGYDVAIDGADTYVDTIYYAYYNQDGIAKVGTFDIDRCYSAGHSSDPSLFDEATYIDATTVGGHLVTVTLNKSDIPSGYTLSSLAVTKSMVFVGVNKRSGENYVAIGGENTLSEDHDLLFSFDKDFSADVTVSVGNGLTPSLLPWNPYHKIDGVPIYEIDMDLPSEHIEIGTDVSLWLPHGVTLDDMNLWGFLDLLTYDVANGWVSLPGNCGAIADNLTPLGNVVVIDYENDVAGYLVRLNGPYTRFPAAVLKSYEGWQELDVGGGLTNYWSNGCGYLKVLYYEIMVGIGSERVRLTPTMPDVINLPSNSGHSPGKHVLYCWNGKSDVIDTDDGDDVLWDGYNYTVWQVGSESNVITIKRHFDDNETTDPSARIDGEFARFVLIPDVAIDEASGATSNVFGATGITNMLTFGTNLPILATPYYDENGDPILYTTIEPYYIGSKLIKTWRDTDEMKTDGITRLTPLDGEDIITVSKNVFYTDTISIAGDLSTVTYAGTGAEIPLDIALLTATAIEDTGGTSSFVKDDILRYKIAFVFDGTSVSPLSNEYYEVTDSVSDYFYVSLDLAFNQQQLEYISKRITAINIYRAPVIGVDESDLYRLAKSVELTRENFSYDPTDDVLKWTGYDDYGSALASFNADAGYSETQKTVSVSRKCQCICNNYLFAGNVTIDSRDLVGINTNNLVVRSLPFQPSIFNYSEEFCVLPFTPIALVPFNSRVYAFGSEQYAIINSDSLAIEHISNSCGISDKDHAVTTDYGIFVYYNHNLYHVNNAEVKSIGDVVRENNSGSYAMSLADFDEEVFVGYVQSRNAVVILGCREETDSQDSIVMMFAYGIATGKWASYEISEASTDYPISLYDKDDSAVFTMYTSDGIRSEYQAFKLFAGAEKREMLLEWIMDCGDPDQDKFIYSVDTYNGRTPTSADVLVGGAPLQADTAAYNTLAPLNTFTLRVSDDTALSEIRLLMRRMVVHNE